MNKFFYPCYLEKQASTFNESVARIINRFPNIDLLSARAVAQSQRTKKAIGLWGDRARKAFSNAYAQMMNNPTAQNINNFFTQKTKSQHKLDTLNKHRNSYQARPSVIRDNERLRTSGGRPDAFGDVYRLSDRESYNRANGIPTILPKELTKY